MFAARGGFFAQPLGPVPVYRSDAYAAYLELAVPFDHVNQFNDVTPAIKGSGSPASKTTGANSTMDAGQVKWTSSPDYEKSVKTIATGGVAAMTYTMPTGLPTCASGSNDYVVEVWAYANDSTTNANWALSSADSGGRWLFGINSGSSFTFASENNIGIGSGWHHIAIVLDNGVKRFYYDGIYKGVWSSSNTGFSVLNVGQFNSGDNNDYRGWLQDLRVYSGTDKGYTGTDSSNANFTLPSSMIQSYS
jgi:hypothetical protein